MKTVHMNFSQLQSFVALADLGSFTEAAYVINLTQSAVSHALSSLENELGVTLIERNRKGVVMLTSTGEKIIPHVRALLAQAEAIQQEAKAAQGMAAGKLRIGSIASVISSELLAGVLTAFRQQYPHIELVLFEGTMQEVGEWVQDSIIDVGFSLNSTACLENTVLTTDEMCVVLSTKHRFSQRESVSPDELTEEGFVMGKNDCSIRILEIAGLPVSKRTPSIPYQASDSSTILAMVREGLGITILPRMTVPKKLDGLVALPLDPPQQMEIGLAFSSSETASPSAKLFIQTALAWTQMQTALA
jgi:DNA-binding transcriptional LysR family regulator